METKGDCMKKIIVLCLALAMVGCSKSGEIEYSEYEHFKNTCDKNDGIKLFYYKEMSKNSHIEDLLVGVKCNDGAVFKEDRYDSIKRIDTKDK